MLKKILFYLSVIFYVAISTTYAQTPQELAFQGFLVDYNGAYSNDVYAKLNKVTWTSNQIPYGADFTFGIKQPGYGFTLNEDSTISIGASVFLQSVNGDTLAYSPDMLGANFEHFSAQAYDNIEIGVTLNVSEPIPGVDSMFATYIFFDKNSDHNITMKGWLFLVDDFTFNHQTDSYTSISGSTITNYYGINLDSVLTIIYWKDDEMTELVPIEYDLQTSNTEVEAILKTKIKLIVLDRNGKYYYHQLSQNDFVIEKQEEGKMVVKLDLKKYQVSPLRHYWLRIDDPEGKWNISSLIRP